jgi:tetratricopeptide (TPR) repeat protein
MADTLRLCLFRICIASCAVLPLATIASSGARAQETSAEPAGYRSLIEAGLAEYDANNFLEARAIFSKAHALYPNARTLRVLGMTEFELRHYRESAAYLREALSSNVRALDPALRQHTQELLDRTAQFLSRLRLTLQPANARLSVDGEPRTLPTDGLVLQLGEHVLEVSADRYHSDRRTVDIAGGEDKTLVIALRPELTVAQPSPPVLQPMAAEESRPVYASPWLWGGIAVVGAGVAVGLMLALRPTRTEIDKAVSTNQSPPGVSLSALRSP